MAKLHGGDGHFSNFQSVRIEWKHAHCQMICNACIHCTCTCTVRGRRGMWTYHRIDKPFKGISGRHKVIDFTSCSFNRTFRESFVHLPWLCHEKFVGYRSAGMCIHRLMGLSDFIFYWGGGGGGGVDIFVRILNPCPQSEKINPLLKLFISHLILVQFYDRQFAQFTVLEIFWRGRGAPCPAPASYKTLGI